MSTIENQQEDCRQLKWCHQHPTINGRRVWTERQDLQTSIVCSVRLPVVTTSCRTSPPPPLYLDPSSHPLHRLSAHLVVAVRYQSRSASLLRNPPIPIDLTLLFPGSVHPSTPDRPHPNPKSFFRRSTATMSTPQFWSTPLRYLRWASIEKPAIFYSLIIGSTGPVMLFAVPPIRRAFGDVDPETIPLTYPSTELPFLFPICSRLSLPPSRSFYPGGYLSPAG